MPFQFSHLTLLSFSVAGSHAAFHGQRARRLNGRSDAEQFEEGLQGRRRSRADGLIARTAYHLAGLKSRFEQSVDTLKFRHDVLVRRCSEVALITDRLRRLAELDDQASGREQCCQLRLTELLEQSPDIPVDRLGPDLLARVEIAAH